MFAGATRSVAGALLLLGVMAAVSAGPASGVALAGTYEVLACSSAPGYANHAWIRSASGTGATYNACPFADGFDASAGGIARGIDGMPTATSSLSRGERPTSRAFNRPGGSGVGKWTFTAPAGATLASFAGTWKCGAVRFGAHSLASPSGGSGTGSCNGTNYTAVTRTFNAGATKLELLASVTCAPSDCRDSMAWISLNEARVTVRDETVPGLAITGGSLTAAGWKRGAQNVTFDGSDNVGIRRGSLIVDGAEVAAESYACDYTRPAPCGNVSTSISLDTGSLANGEHTWEMVAVDAAGNTARSVQRTFRTDNSTPVLGLVEATPPGWVDRYAGEVTAAATDQGAGLARVELTEPLPPPTGDRTRSEVFTAPGSTDACRGTDESPCPPAGTKTFAFDTDGYRDGIVTSSVVAVDAADNRSQPQRYDLKVDHTPPQIAPSGPLMEFEGGVITQSGTYQLTVNVTDGVRGGAPAEQRSGVDSVELLVSKDEGEFVSEGVRRFDECTGDSCPGESAYTLDTRALGEGLHRIKVIATDRLHDEIPDELKPRHVSERTMEFYVDLLPPEIETVTHDPALPTGWVDDVELGVDAEATDSGTGVREIALAKPTSDGHVFDRQRLDCGPGSASRDRCPKARSGRFTYRTGELPNGDAQLEIIATDGADRVSPELEASLWGLKIDHSAPEIRLGGDLFRKAPATMHGGAYRLAIEAADGNGYVPSSGVRSVSVLLRRDDQAEFALQASWSQDATEDSQTLNRDWYFMPKNYAAGTYAVRVEARDQLGHLASDEFQVTVARPSTRNNADLDIFGTARDGERVIGVPPEAWDGTIDYQWQSCEGDQASCQDIPGATERWLDINSPDVGRRLRLQARRTNTGATASAMTSVVAAAPPVADGSPSIVGPANSGETVAALARGIFDGTEPEYDFQWLRCPENGTDDEGCSVIPGKTADEYVLQDSDVGSVIRVRVVAHNSAGSATIVSTETDVVTAGSDLSRAASAASEASTPPDRQAAVRYRAARGLRTDDAYIDALDADPDLESSRDAWGVSLSRLEQRDMQLRAEVAAAADVVDAFGRGPAASQFGGYYVDPLDGGRLLVLLTDLDSSLIDALRDRFPYPTRLRFVEAAHLLSALEATKARIDADVDALAAASLIVYSLQIDVPTSRVLVGVASEIATAQERLTSLYGPTVAAVPDGPIERVGRNSLQLLKGGLKINSPTTGEDCTSGFNGNATSVHSLNRVRSMITAGHCSKAYTTYRTRSPRPGGDPGGPTHHNPEDWNQGGKTFGHTDASSVNTGSNRQQMRGKRYSDVINMTVDNRKNTGNTIYAGERSVRRVTDTATNDNDDGSDVIISLGQGSDSRNMPGRVARKDWVDDQPGYPKVYETRVVDGTACQRGDSGSPVYQLKRDGTAVAIGIVIARVSNRDHRCVYGHIRHITKDTTFMPYIRGNGLPGQS